ncbi:hypothetical protein IQ273_18845 [Nodosilinea sp. LEGE 07298]|uniref:hypothetical protein n=1 Tax=Nodosilinea sp. LEGE 07298 TaxID=2777970 RepID=UPI00187F4874|nr:hypothetical protein [Nodosilinea sp. LEGE 07298]MBE9111465.1 hypothetical protein [Nodosilinea sp. LEGE 07298]
MSVQNGLYNLTIQQSATFGIVLDLDLDLTGLGVRAQLTKHLHPTSPRVTFQTFIEQPASEGRIIVGLTSDQTVNLTPNIYPIDWSQVIDWDDRDTGLQPHEVDLLIPGRRPYYWDLVVYDGSPESIVNRFLAGEILVTAGVTLDV